MSDQHPPSGSRPAGGPTGGRGGATGSSGANRSGGTAGGSGRRRRRRGRSGSGSGAGTAGGRPATGQGRTRQPAGSGAPASRSGGDGRRGGGSGGGARPAGRQGGSRGGGGGAGGHGDRRRDAGAEAAGAVATPVASGSATSDGATAGGVSVTASEIAANRRRAVLLAAAAGFVPGVLAGVIVGAVVGVVGGVVAAVVAAVAVAVVVPRWATGFVLGRVGGRQVDEDEEPRLANLVAGLCATFGVPYPRLWVVDDRVPNACALGRRPATAVLVVTSGLLDRLDLIEMEGVVAHELVHVKRHDTAVSEMAVAVLSPLVRMTGRDGMVHAAVGRGREYRADEVAAATVRYPPGLHHALTLMEDGPAPAEHSVFRGPRWTVTRWLWADPMVGDRDRVPVGEVDATSVRRDALVEW